ncbi:MAG: DUF2723 domain-containing protein [Chloroflexi bacterium]|nr:DUF2723 domain-containing protein [Chloroflexota bacterium]
MIDNSPIGGRRRTTIGARAFVARSGHLPALVFAVGFTLYLSTLAPGLVFGDPAEYTLMPHLWAVLHPPGYAFMTLLVKAWQTLVPIGALAYRTNLLSAAAGALGAAMVCRMAQTLFPDSSDSPGGGAVSGIVAALSLITASNYWQHSIHTNAHIVTAALASVSLFLLLRWRATKNDRWLWAFAFVAGLSVTHHPLLAFGFPAYAAFILVNRPRLKTLIQMAGFALLGLAPWLYFPLRSAIAPPPPFGPRDMNTLDGFLNLALARGLTGVNLFHFGPGEQWHRLIVFASLIQLQFAWPVALLALVGLAWLARRDGRAALLLGLHALVNLVFILNSVQDVMAYLLTPLVSIAALIGAGAFALGQWLKRPRAVLLLILFPLANLLWLAPRISLRHLRAADDFADSVFAHFGGKGMGAVLLSDWEHATPLWYRQHVDGQTLDPADLSVVYVNKPFVDAVWENIDRGPLYLLEYNPAIVNTGFRLRAEGAFYRIEPPPAVGTPTIPHPLDSEFGPAQLLGYDMLADSVRAGDVVPIILYLRAPQITERIIHPFARLGPWEYRFTTDSHLLSPYWQGGEVIAERWEMIVPPNADAGEYPLTVGFSDLTTGEDFSQTVSLGAVAVTRGLSPLYSPLPQTERAANFGQRVGVEWARGWAGGVPARTAPWAEPMAARPGQSVEIRIKWRALATVENSYTVFLHLMSADNGLIASSDYTPLGGAFPTMLWLPKWLPGQSAVDPYTIPIPAEAAPGEYYIEMGLYGLRSVVRLPAFDENGNLAGDRFVLGWITVGP